MNKRNRDDIAYKARLFCALLGCKQGTKKQDSWESVLLQPLTDCLLLRERSKAYDGLLSFQYYLNLLQNDNGFVSSRDSIEALEIGYPFRGGC